MTHTQTQGADGAGTKTNPFGAPAYDPASEIATQVMNLPWTRHGLGKPGESFDDDGLCDRHGDVQIIARNVIEATPAPAATPGVPDSLRALRPEDLTDAYRRIAAQPAGQAGVQDSVRALSELEEKFNASRKHALENADRAKPRDDLYDYYCGQLGQASAYFHAVRAVQALIAAQPAGQAGDAGAEDESALSDRKELSGQNVSLSPLRGQIANAKATGVNGEMAAGEAYTVFDPARTTSDPYDDRPGPWYDMKKVREIEAATGIAFAAAHPERALGRDTDGLIEGFAAALKAKLRAAEAKYGWQNGWLKDDWSANCQRELMRHVGKGDPLDVAAYAAFCWHHGWSTSSAPTGTPDTEKCLSALTAAVSTCINDKGITDLGTIKRAWFYARTGRDEPVGSRAWDELRAMVRASEASSGLEGVETIQVWPLVEPAPNSTRTGAAETEGLPSVEDTIRRLETVRTNAREAHKVWLANTAHYAAEWLRHLAARPEAPSDAGWSREDLEAFVAREWPEGRSAGAAARELVRALGVRGLAPTLQRLLTDLLGQINFASTDRAQILADFANAAPEAARMAKIDSFERWNPRVFDPTPPSDPAPSGQAEG